MYSKDMLIGIFLSLAKTDIHIDKTDTLQIGYRVRLRINIRGEGDFLKGVQRSLIQHHINSTYIEEESKSRPRPLLRIGGIKNIALVVHGLVGNLPDAKNQWPSFKKAVRIVAESRHLQLEGLEELFTIKGVM